MSTCLNSGRELLVRNFWMHLRRIFWVGCFGCRTITRCPRGLGEAGRSIACFAERCNYLLPVIYSNVKSMCLFLESVFATHFVKQFIVNITVRTYYPRSYPFPIPCPMHQLDSMLHSSAQTQDVKFIDLSKAPLSLATLLTRQPRRQR
jgi:hypothetical protein